jgi:crotonobetainyl-CoA:carnitine CoA-transferase CaiB-like acyl-CoA transferase
MPGKIPVSSVFDSNAKEYRVENRKVLEKGIEDITKTKTTSEWESIFEGKGLPYARVNDLMDTLNHRHGIFPLPISLSLIFKNNGLMKE